MAVDDNITDLIVCICINATVMTIAAAVNNEITNGRTTGTIFIQQIHSTINSP